MNSKEKHKLADKHYELGHGGYPHGILPAQQETLGIMDDARGYQHLHATGNVTTCVTGKL